MGLTGYGFAQPVLRLVIGIGDRDRTHGAFHPARLKWLPDKEILDCFNGKANELHKRIRAWSSRVSYSVSRVFMVKDPKNVRGW
jgi:hypothetical protein